MENKVNPEDNNNALDKYREMLQEVQTSADTIIAASANRGIYPELESKKAEYDAKKAALVQGEVAEPAVEEVAEAPVEAPAAEVEEAAPAAEETAPVIETSAPSAVYQNFGKIGKSNIDFGEITSFTTGQAITSEAIETRKRVSGRYQSSKEKGVVSLIRNSAQSIVKKMNEALEVSEEVPPAKEVKEITPDIIL